MSLATQAMLKALQAQRPSVVADNLQATIGGGAAAIPLRDGAHRFLFVKNPGDSAVLPSLAMHEAMTSMLFVLNDGASSLSLWPWPGDSLNGAVNTPLSVPSGSVAIILKSDTGSALDWRAGIIS
jgi:hypothetical protein